MSPRHLRPLVVALLGVAVAIAYAIGGLGADALLAIPSLALFLPLLAGRYVGERGIERLAVAVRTRAPRRIATSIATTRTRIVDAVAHGGLLLARRLAGRAPPVVFA